jgi:3',5'-cyclic-AMP phosphodiesterase
VRITSFDRKPISEIPFLNAGKGQGSFYVARLPVHVGQLADLPDDLDAIIATADLQGRERFEDGLGGPPRLLGEVLPERLAVELLPELSISPQRTGILLAGDFYTFPNLDKRGGSGDVAGVWQAFSRQFQWVVGVAGNHDMFGRALAPLRRLSANSHYLDGDRVTMGDLLIAGIGGIVGDPRKPHRKTDQHFVEHIELCTSPAPDILVMHDGPDDVEQGQKGSPIIRQALERSDSTLVVRGHAHWHAPLLELSNGTQVLNVECRVAVLRR